MRILVTIPHYFRAGVAGHSGRRHGSQSPDPEPRARALTACISSLHQLYGQPQCTIEIARKTTRPANQLTAGAIDLVICTTSGQHTLDRLPFRSGYYEHHATRTEPLMLGFECHAILRDRLGRYDFYCYLEDDLTLHDPWLFLKLCWFTGKVGDDKLLQPNRFEVGVNQIVTKAYVDGELAERVTARFQNIKEFPRCYSEIMGERIEFQRTRNPHAGCYFLTAAQMDRWARQPYFLDRDTSFVGPLESAATLGIMRTFKVYKPAPRNASFLEIEHYGSGFLSQIRAPRRGTRPT